MCVSIAASLLLQQLQDGVEPGGSGHRRGYQRPEVGDDGVDDAVVCVSPHALSSVGVWVVRRVSGS